MTLHGCLLDFGFVCLFLLYWATLVHMEVPRLGVKSELLLLLACATAPVTPDPSLVCNLHHSLSSAGFLTHRARPGIKPHPSSWILVGSLSLSHKGNSWIFNFVLFLSMVFLGFYFQHALYLESVGFLWGLLPPPHPREFLFILFIYFCLFAISWAAPSTYGGSQARGQIGAVATSLREFLFRWGFTFKFF